MKIVKFEMKRAFVNWRFRISLMIGLVICFTDLAFFFSQYGAPGEKSLIQVWIGTDYQFAYNSLFYVLLPILACLPYAGSYFTDMNSGYDKNICLKVSRKQYLLAKVFAVFSSAFSCVAIPLSCSLVVCAGLYPNYIPEKLHFLTAGIIDCNMFADEFNTNPVLYCVIYILIDSMIAGMLGLVSICVSKWVSNHFTAVVIPFVLYILTGVLCLTEDGYSFSIMEMANPVQKYISEFYHLVMIYGVVVAVAGILSLLWSRKRDII